MVKSTDEVVADFNEIVNMTADEIDEFLKTEASETTGYKEEGSGESIGHESGRKIVDILRRNPTKDESKYTDEDKEHMRRVVSYAKRHLAQEGKLKDTKTPEELEKTKSTRSLKNWGHDPLKTLSKSEQASAKPTSKAKPASKKAEKPKSSSKKETQAQDDGDGDEGDAKKDAEKPKSSGKPKSKGKPAAEKAEKPESTSKKESAASAKVSDDAEVGEKREAEKPVEKSEKPASKKAKTTKEPTEGTRKPPSRGAKKA